MKVTLRLIAVTASAVLGVAAAHAAPEFFPHAVAPNAQPLPFSDAVLVGDTLYVAGHLGLDPKTGHAPPDTRVEAKLVLDAVQATLNSAGLTMDDLVSVTVYCTDLSLYDSFNSAYAGYFHGRYPARALVGVAVLLRGGHFEVQGVAVKPGAGKHGERSSAGQRGRPGAHLGEIPIASGDFAGGRSRQPVS